METSASCHCPLRKTTGDTREKKTMMFKEFTKGFSQLSLRTSLRRRLGRYNNETSIRPLNFTRSLAVSDGELNVVPEERGASVGLCSSSNSSLPTVPSDGASGVGKVASWAVSFERLLQDPTGVLYFTAFLKSEVSAENILFWQACEKFRQIPANQKEKLNQEARSIYSSYLSGSASHPINIDDTVRIEEREVRNPHPDMYHKAQQQIFKLMKFDSYTRFVRSQLYQSCMLANVEGRPLPELGPRLKSTATRKTAGTDIPALSNRPKADQKPKEKPKVKPGKSLPLDLDEGAEKRKGAPQNKLTSEKGREKRGSWGAELADHAAVLQSTARSGSLLKAVELERERWRAGQAEKYCCVFLPDGTASLAPARPGLSIRTMLTGLCEKRGLPLSDVIIYLQGKDKKPLSLDQDSSVLKEQQVFLELRVTFAVEIVSTGKTVGIVVKSSKSLQEALTPVLQKQRLRPQDVIVTMSGSKESLSMSMAVTSLANKKLTLDRVKGTEQSSRSMVSGSSSGPVSQVRRSAVVEVDTSSLFSSDRVRTNTRLRNPAVRKTYDMDGLMELLSRTQCCSVDDQRGLLKKEQLWLPQFLQLPLDEAHEEDQEEDQEEEQGKRGGGMGGLQGQDGLGLTETELEPSPVLFHAFPEPFQLPSGPPLQFSDTGEGGEEQTRPPFSDSQLSEPDPGRETVV
ncbi:regulator of G-protein signaling 14 isoform X3 [Coregonus clupeaformis]|uniref:regulator of G-protein signaling 14 isoform X3 n=1 Tax=Coregonus clupeaformis TaxID=59861 RepID=UPI001E1C40C9|nr:regulator of G-protein signaling 14 isoform X3 [Coregonus clupeaformis]